MRLLVSYLLYTLKCTFSFVSIDCHIKLYDTTGGYLKEFQDVVALNVGWSIIDTAYRYGRRHP